MLHPSQLDPTMGCYELVLEGEDVMVDGDTYGHAMDAFHSEAWNRKRLE